MSKLKNERNTVLQSFQTDFSVHDSAILSFDEYLEEARVNAEMYASPAHRLLKAIGDPILTDTSKDSRLSKIFGNQLIKTYAPFQEFYGLETVIQQIVSFLTHAAQGLEEGKQILYLLGPVGSAKSSLAETLKDLMEQQPFYALEGSPINESPLGFFNKSYQDKLNIPGRYLPGLASPWAYKRLKEYGGDLTRFNVVKLYPSKSKQLAIAKTEPGDENNQDISTLVGKVNIRNLEKFNQNDPDCYSFSGGLCRGNRGIFEFVEMFKAPIKTLFPLLTATQEGNYNPTEGFSSIPFEGIILAHSNETEWQNFKNNKANEAFLDRLYPVEVPYCLRKTEDKKILEKIIKHSDLRDAPIAPYTLELLAEFDVLTRLDPPENSAIVSKMRVYDGEFIRNQDVHAKTFKEYRQQAKESEGFTGISTRWAYKLLAKVFNHSNQEIEANPVHLLYELETTLINDRLPSTVRNRYLNYIKEHLRPTYAEKIRKDIYSACLDSSADYGQALFDRYVLYADHWCNSQELRIDETGQIWDKELLDKELEKYERAASIHNTKDFRQEIVNFVYKYRAKHENKNPPWTIHEPLRAVLEQNMFEQIKEYLPVISFKGTHKHADDQKKHQQFVDAMIAKGYTPYQLQVVWGWYERYKEE